jgi:zinc/manganese transport system permease protein
LGLLSAPAGAAHRLTANPYAGVVISSLIAVAATWGGLALSYSISSLPPSSAIIGLAGGAFAVAAGADRLRKWRTGERRRRESWPGRRRIL